MIKGVKFVTIPVRDQDRALAFYTEALGFTVVTDQPFNDEQRWIELRVRGSDTRIVLFTTQGHEDRIGTAQGVTFLAEDVARTHEELSSKGVEFAVAPQITEWGSYAIFKDPDGNQFVLSSR